MPEPDATTELETSPPGEAPPATSPQPLVPGVEPGHLVPCAEAAALSFLGLLALGAVLLVAVKLQYPNLGAGANTIDVLSSVVILALATLRVPIHLGDVTFTVLPLGALPAIFFIVRWACRAAAPSAPPRRGLLVGAVFALIAMTAALVFRFRFEPDAVYAGAFGSAVGGFVWVSLFSALSFAGTKEPPAKRAGRWIARLRQSRPSLYEGASAGALMLLGTLVLALGAGLLWAIVSLLTGGGPHDLDLGDLVAALAYIAAFAPNLVVAVASLSLGAPVDVGAGVTVHGRVRGNLEHWSVFADGPGLPLFLLLVPLAACVAAGYWARQNSRRPESALRILLAAAVTFGGVLAVLGWLGEARLGSQLASSRGFGIIAPRAWLVFLLGSLWAAAGGYAGWTLAGRQRS